MNSATCPTSLKAEPKNAMEEKLVDAHLFLIDSVALDILHLLYPTLKLSHDKFYCEEHASKTF